jgi:GNAT superfamily N-acetyltransferase
MLQHQENSLDLKKLDDANRLAVAQFFHNVWHDTQAPLQPPEKARYRDLAFFADRMSGRASTVAAYRGHQLAGFVSWTQNKLNSLFVHRDLRGRGVGLQLMRHAETAMFKAGHPHLELDCVVGNEAARRFYERHDWHLKAIATDQREKPEGMVFTQIWTMVKNRGVEITKSKI